MFSVNMNIYTQSGAALLFLGLCYLLPATRVAAVGVLSESDNGARIYGKLDENALKNFRESFLETRDGPLWNPTKNSVQGRDTFQEPQVMDKPGIFFPDDINPWTPWSSCVGEVQTRTRGPAEHAKLMKCGHIECSQTRSCQSSFVSRSFQWTGWGQWSECTANGGRVSTRTRVRQCQDLLDEPYRTRNAAQSSIQFTPSCPGSAQDKVECEMEMRGLHSSEWMNWSQWSDCERGNKFRTRYCKGSLQCVGARYETNTCSLTTNNVVDRTSRQLPLCYGPFSVNLRNCRGVPSRYDRTRSHPSQQTRWRN